MAAVFVTGATGTVGSAVVAQLAAADQQVIAAVRRPGLRSWPEGVSERRFDFEYPQTHLEEVLDGVDRLFLLRPPAIADVATRLFPLVDAAARVGIRQVVFLSLQGVQANRATPHHAVETHLRQLQAPFTFLRPNFFMQNLITAYGRAIRDEGRIFVPAGRSRTAFIDARDLGRVAASVFTQDGHLGRAYTLSGEQSLSYDGVARIMTEVLGRPISYARPTEDHYLDRLRSQGAPAEYVEVQRMIHRVVRLNMSALPNKAVRRLTGTPATTLRQFVIDHRDSWNR